MTIFFTIAILIYSVGIILAYRQGLKDGMSVNKGENIQPIKEVFKHNTSTNKKAVETFADKVQKERDEAIERFINNGGLPQ